jgi:hypothetical protein
VQLSRDLEVEFGEGLDEGPDVVLFPFVADA